MKRNLDNPILKLDGTEFDDKPTLGVVCFQATATTLVGDEKMTGAQKMALYAIAQKVHKGGTVELSAEDITLLKERIGKAFGVIVVGRAYELLEQDSPTQPDPT